MEGRIAPEGSAQERVPADHHREMHAHRPLTRSAPASRSVSGFIASPITLGYLSMTFAPGGPAHAVTVRPRSPAPEMRNHAMARSDS